MASKIEWEHIYYDPPRGYKTYEETTERVKVFGGWIVKNFHKYDNMFSESMVFIPDPDHKWSLDQEAK